jgi:hypothetical protein
MNDTPDKDTLDRWRRWHDRHGTTAKSPKERQVEALELVVGKLNIQNEHLNRIAAALEKLSSGAAINYFGTLTQSSVNLPVEKIPGEEITLPRYDVTFDEAMETMETG